jgi:segregation and condensation protein A
MEYSLGPIDILMNLVITRKIDPWNIDIVDLTRKYLQKIEEARRIDMRVSGKTILVAAILIRMQSETILEKKKEEKEEEIDEDIEVAPVLPPLRRESKEITLPALLEALLETLEDYEKKKERKPKKIKKEIKQIIKIDIYKKDLEKYIEKLYILIKESVNEEGIIRFENLIFDKTPLEIARTLLYLLFLEQQERVEIIQKEFFGPIYIRPAVSA